MLLILIQVSLHGAPLPDTTMPKQQEGRDRAKTVFSFYSVPLVTVHVQAPCVRGLGWGDLMSWGCMTEMPVLRNPL